MDLGFGEALSTARLSELHQDADTYRSMASVPRRTAAERPERAMSVTLRRGIKAVGRCRWHAASARAAAIRRLEQGEIAGDALTAIIAIATGQGGRSTRSIPDLRHAAHAGYPDPNVWACCATAVALYDVDTYQPGDRAMDEMIREQLGPRIRMLDHGIADMLFVSTAMLASRHGTRAMASHLLEHLSNHMTSLGRLEGEPALTAATGFCLLTLGVHEAAWMHLFRAAEDGKLARQRLLKVLVMDELASLSNEQGRINDAARWSARASALSNRFSVSPPGDRRRTQGDSSRRTNPDGRVVTRSPVL